MMSQQADYQHPLHRFGYRRPRFWMWRFSPRAYVAYSALKDIWLIVRGKCTLHRAWQEGHDQGTRHEYERIIVNGGDLVPYVMALREAKGALWEMWPQGKEASFTSDPAVRAIDAVLNREPWNRASTQIGTLHNAIPGVATVDGRGIGVIETA